MYCLHNNYTLFVLYQTLFVCIIYIINTQNLCI
nr:MAG TPA: hypothetical protein [Caudoviricetes sp.]